MSDRILTPLEEMQARQLARIAADIDRLDCEGSFARLLLKFDPNEIAMWLFDERKRGVSSSDADSAFAQIMACCLLAATGTRGNPRDAYKRLIADVHREACRRISGEVPVDVVEAAPDGSRQREATIEGIFAGTGGGSDA